MRLSGRGSLIVAGIAVLFAATSARSEDLDAKKTAAQMFESTCSACHRGPQGLAKGQSASSLVSFLRQHYTTGPGPAGQLAAYLLANPGEGRSKPATTAVRPDAPIERTQPPASAHAAPAAETTESVRPATRTSKRHPTEQPPAAHSEPVPDRQAGPAGEQPAPKGRLRRAARKPNDGPETDPGARTGPAVRAPDVVPARAESTPAGRPPAGAESTASTPPGPPAATAAGEPPSGSGDQSAFSAPTP